MKVRIISGLIGIGVFVATMFAAVNISPLIFHVLLAAVGCIGVYEALKATGYVKSKFLIVSSIVYAAITPFVYSIELLEAEFNLNLLIRHEACLVVYAVVIFTAAMLKHKSISPMQVAYTFSATIAITFAFWSLAAVFSMNDGHGLFYILLVFLMAWICDTGAYFTGYFFGKHKLAPEISPKKTIEGAIGGVVTDVLVMFVSCLIFNTLTENTANMPLIVGVAPIFAVAGMMGDLIFSYIKRDCKIKDYGNIMPGHGGVLDRFDSVIVIAPLMYLLITHFPFVI